MKEDKRYKGDRENLFMSNQQEIKKLKGLETVKGKLERQLNKYKKIKENHAFRENNKFQKKYEQKETQIDQYYDREMPLRRDFAGVLGNKCRFDDRLLLREDKKTFIKGVYVY